MNHFANYLTFCVNRSILNDLTFFKDVEVFDENKNKINVAKGSLVKVNSYKQDSSNYILNMTLVENQKSVTYELCCNDEAPVTHFKNAEEAYKHCNFTQIPLTENLENFIFSRSAKFASKYACDVSRKRLSSYLENKILKNYKYLITYCIEFNIDLTEDQEKVFLNDDSGEFVATYGIQKIKGKLPEMLHNYLIMKFADAGKRDSGVYKSYWVHKYFESIK